MKVRYNINPLLINSASGETTDLPQVTIETDYVSNCPGNTFIVPNSVIYKTVSFGNVTESVTLILTSSVPLTVKFNGGSQEFELSAFLIKGTYDQVEIRNLSGEDAEVRFEVYGV